MRRCLTNLLSAVVILLLILGIGYGLVWISSFPNPLHVLLPSLGILGFDGAGAADGSVGAGAPPYSTTPPSAHSAPPPARRSGPGAPPPPPPAARWSPTPPSPAARHRAPPPARRSGPGAPPPPARRSGPGAPPPPPPARRSPTPPSPAARHRAPPPPPARRSGPGAPPPGARRSSTPPSPEQEQKVPSESGSANTGNATTAPPPCTPCVSVEENVTREVMLLLGCGISILSFSNPVIIYWSLGGSLPETITFHSLWDLIATTTSCFAWLLFGITQLHIEGNRILGVETVVVNLMGVIVYTLCTVIKMAGVVGAANVRIKGCVGAVLALCGPTFIVLCFVVFGPLKRDNPATVWISFGAALIQVISQLLPFRSIWLLCNPPANAPPQHANTKKLIIFSRSCNLVVCVYWAMYCILTYQHTFFEFANVAGAALAFVTFTLHIIYALEPQAAV